MARFSRLYVYQTLLDVPIVPLFSSQDLDVCKNVLSACYKAGIRVFELTNRGDFAHELFAELVKTARIDYPDLILGVGTISDPATAALYLQLGANFVFSPSSMPTLPKCATSEK